MILHIGDVIIQIRKINNIMLIALARGSRFNRACYLKHRRSVYMEGERERCTDERRECDRETKNV